MVQHYIYIYIYGHLDYSKNLTSYINGNKIVVPNTITTIANRLNSSTIEGGTSNIANATFPDLVSVSGTKTWDDANNQDEKRPDSVSINLLANGTKVDSKTVSATDDWKYSFTNLDKYKDGTEIIYTVTEDTVPDYTTSIDGTDITNSYTPGKTNVSVTKAWNDSNNQDGLRPNKITVQLYADGKESGKPVELNSSNDWTITWDNLDLKQSGKEIAYTVKEVDTVAGYTTTTDDTDKGNIIITNTHNTKGRKTGYIPINKNNNKFDSPLTKLLPKTGEMKNFIFSVIGVLVLLILFTFYIIRKYKKTRM